MDKSIRHNIILQSYGSASGISAADSVRRAFFGGVL